MVQFMPRTVKLTQKAILENSKLELHEAYCKSKGGSTCLSEQKMSDKNQKDLPKVLDKNEAVKRFLE